LKQADDLHSLFDVETTRVPEAESGGSTTKEITVKFEEIIEACKASLDFLAGFLNPDVFKYAFPPVFVEIWILLCDRLKRLRDFSKIAIGLPRGLGKTTVIRLLIVYTILFTKKKFICVYSSREGLAENTIADVIDFMDSHNFKKVFGDWRVNKELDQSKLKKFGFRGKNMILAALGAGTSMRGLNLKLTRPDFMIFDDIQTAECAESVVESEKLERWMVGTAMKAGGKEGCTFLYIGNMYAQMTCILKKLKHNPEWISFIAGAIDINGESIWEELYPYEQIVSELKSDIAMGHPEIFFSEVLNDEFAGSRAGIDVSKIPKNPYKDGFSKPDAKFIIIDPASGKLNGDNVEIGYFEVYDQTPVLQRLKSGKFSPGETIRLALELCFETGCPCIGIEDVAYQSTLLYWFGQAMDKLQIHGQILCVPVAPRGVSKVSRISRMFKELIAAKPELYLGDLVWDAVIFEICQFDPKKTDNLDNKLDVCAYARQMVEEHYWSCQTSEALEDDAWAKAKVVSQEQICSF